MEQEEYKKLIESVTDIKCPNCGAPMIIENGIYSNGKRYMELPKVCCLECNENGVMINEKNIKTTAWVIGTGVSVINTDKCERASKKEIGEYKAKKLKEIEDIYYRNWLRENENNMPFIVRYLKENNLI